MQGLVDLMWALVQYDVKTWGENIFTHPCSKFEVTISFFYKSVDWFLHKSSDSCKLLMQHLLILFFLWRHISTWKFRFFLQALVFFSFCDFKFISCVNISYKWKFEPTCTYFCSASYHIIFWECSHQFYRLSTVHHICTEQNRVMKLKYFQGMACFTN